MQSKDYTLVVDTNVVIAALLRPGISRNLFFFSRIHLFSPTCLEDELSEHQEEFRPKSGLDRTAYLRAVETFLLRTTILQESEFGPHEKHARRICPDPKDWPFFAAALYLGCPLWSNDKRLKKQKEIEVYDTSSLLKEIEDVPWHAYGLKILAQGEDADELFKF